MTLFDDVQIRDLFESNLAAAKACLGQLSFCCSTDTAFGGLSGWVFEQTFTFCLRQELKALHINTTIHDQVGLGGKAKVDRVIGSIAIELKARGMFDKRAPYRYAKYKIAAEKKGYCYLYVALQETYGPYREATRVQLGTENAFFLDIPGDWSRLMNRIVRGLGDVPAVSAGPGAPGSARSPASS
jgi:hypothetical protein